jgi:hypothetical protein
MGSRPAFQDKLVSEMYFKLLRIVSGLIVAASAAPTEHAFSTFSNLTIFVPPANYTDPGTLYARTVELEDGVLLATWENYSPEPPLVYAPIFRSTNGGESWTEIAKVMDQVNNFGLRYQPFLYELPDKIGEYPAGTVLLATNSIPTDLNFTKIDVYQSPDKGFTWHFVSHVAAGGAAIPDNGIPAIWEPFLMLHDGQMIIYYSDQRDPLHGQKLVHQTSRDLLTWTPPVDDVSYFTFTDRPGMTTVTLLPNGNYMMTYEFGGGPLASGATDFEFPVYYRINKNPLDFNNSIGLPLVTDTGIQPTSSPYITWTPVGGPNGTILVSCGTLGEVFINQALGDVNSWKSIPTPEGVSCKFL